MSFRLKRKESVPDGLHRITREEFEALETHLRALHQTDDQEDQIHEARRHLKKLRALCHVWRECIESPLVDQENDILQGVARDFSSVRDAAVRVTLLSGLIDDGLSSPTSVCHRLVRHWTTEHAESLRKAVTPAALRRHLQTLATSRDRFALMPICHADWDSLSKAVRRSYRRARKGFQRATDDPANDENWHDWRKAAKGLLYQLTLLERAGTRIQGILTLLDRLTEQLGLARDLTLLSAIIVERQPRFGDSPSGAKVLALAKRRQAKLKSAAATAGGRLFAMRPSRFMEKVDTAWKNWR